MGRPFFMLLLVALSWGTLSLAAETTFDYKNSGADWPDLCRTGQTQSPLNIVKSKTLEIGPNPNLRFSYTPLTEMEVLHTGKVIEVVPPPEAQCFFYPYSGQTYQLVQFHFHSPSEHTVDGALGLAEGHFVHKNISGGVSSLAVWGVIFGLHPQNVPNPWLDRFLPLVPKNSTIPQNVTLREPFDPSGAFSNMSLDYYTYPGSLTTPPCSETVTWFVAQAWELISVEQLKLMYDLNEALTGEKTNDRLVQASNGREIKSFTTKTSMSFKVAPTPLLVSLAALGVLVTFLL